jgi:hypothetical protein
MTPWLFVGLFVALLAIHMTRPRLERRRLSSARFFDILPPARQRRLRWRLGNPLASRPFYLQLPILLLLISAIGSSQIAIAGKQTQGIGAWIVVDRSASMSTRQNDETRMDATYREIAQAIDKTVQASRGTDFCFKLSTFDLEKHDLLSTRDADAVLQEAKTLTPRALGTDLNLVRGLFESLDQPEPDCTPTHLVVVSDLPAPEWITPSLTSRVIWRDVASVVANIGFTAIQGIRDPLTGMVHQVDVTVTAYGKAPIGANLVVVAPDGQVMLDESLGGLADESWTGTFVPSGPGRYRLRLSPGGAYTFDDDAAIDVSDERSIRVDWQLNDQSLLGQLGWSQDSAQPHLRVLPHRAEVDHLPTLIVGAGYLERAVGVLEICDFYETSPLLTDLNFDVAETLGISGVHLSELPQGFRPVLRDVNNSTWFAQRDDPPAAFVPGPPMGTDANLVGTDANLHHFSTTAFFNAVRWLLRARPLPPLYALTTDDAPDPEGTRLALHEDEGNTTRPSHSLGRPGDLESVITTGPEKPIWPMLLALAVALFTIERGLAAFGGEKWH